MVNGLQKVRNLIHLEQFPKDISVILNTRKTLLVLTTKRPLSIGDRSLDLMAFNP